MRCADSTTGVAVKVLVEKDVITEIGIVVHFAVECVAGTFTIFITKEDVAETLLLEEEGEEGGTC